MVVRIKLILIIGGLALAVLAVQDLRLVLLASAEPQEITCAELIANGPGDNAHVVLTDFVLWTHEAVLQGRSQDDSSWSVVWIPAACDDGDVRVLVKARNVNGKTGLGELAARQKLQGIVTNAIEPLEQDEATELAKFYKNADLFTCWILEIGRSPAPTSKMATYLAAAAAAIALGVYLSLRQRDKPGASAMFRPEDLPPVDAEILPDEEQVDERKEEKVDGLL